jgi:cytochrome P450
MSSENVGLATLVYDVLTDVSAGLRLYPPVPLNNRTATRTIVLPAGGGPSGDSPILVRRGEVVVYSSYVNARQKNVWGADADEFRPDRWDDLKLSEARWAYLPFSDGPRACLGQEFAMMVVAYVIVKLLQRFPTVQLSPDEINEKLGTERHRLTLVLTNANGCRVVLDGEEL